MRRTTTNQRRVRQLSLAAATTAVLAPACVSRVSANTLYWDFDRTTNDIQFDGNGTWDASTTNAWWNGSGNQLWTDSGGEDVAWFGLPPTHPAYPLTVTATRTITIAGTVNATQLHFQPLRTGFGQDWTLNGGTINLTGTALIDPFDGQNSIRINSTISGSAGLLHDSSGAPGQRNASAAVVLAGANVYAGQTVIRDSTLQLYNNSALGANGAGNDTLVEQGGRLSLGGLNGTSTPLTVAEDLTFGSSGAAGVLRSGNANNTFAGNINLNASDAAVIQDGAFTFTVSGNIATIGGANRRINFTAQASGGNGTLKITGNISDGVGGEKTSVLLGSGNNANVGTVEISGNNTFSGSTTARGGTTLLASNTALGTTIANLGDGGNGGSDNMAILLKGPVTVANIFQLGNNATGGKKTLGGASADAATFGSRIQWNGYTGALYVTAASGGTTTFAGQFNDGGAGTTTASIIKTGLGTVRFTSSGGNLYGGGTQVNQGTLLINNNALFGAGSGSVNVASGAAVGGAAKINALSIQSGGILNPGEGIGTFTATSATLNSASLNFDLGSAGADRLVVSTADALTLAGTSAFTFTDIGGLGAGTYTLVDYSGAALANLSAFSIVNSTLGSFTLSLANNTANTSVDLVVAGGVTAPTWAVDNSGSWSVAGNWTGGVPNTAGAVANFGSVITSDRVVTLDTPQTAGILNFDNSKRYTLSGATLTLDNSASPSQINVVSGNHTIAAPVAFSAASAITVSTGNTLTLSGPSISSAGVLTKAGAGNLELTHLRGGSLNVTLGKATILAGATNNSTSGATKVSDITVAGGASLDATNNSVIIDHSGAFSEATLRASILSGYNAGSWTGAGITSSSAATTSATSTRTAIGYATSNFLFGNAGGTIAGQGVDQTAEVLIYTLAGDANLDGKVNTLDFNQLAGGFGSGSNWVAGDFNYNGVVDSSDFAILAANYGKTLPVSAPSLGAVVPEPAALGLLGCAALTLRRRRH